jgi:benzoyl-CoA reductase/2-hydroxyglutaryl-CoA dehydratase subunit BcrC/BadD/HgdB
LPKGITDAFDDPATVAKIWRAKGGKVIGILGDEAPRELATALGFLPIRISPGRLKVSGNAQTSPSIDLAPDMRLILDAFITRQLDWIDGLIIARDSESYARLFAVARELINVGEITEHPRIAFLDHLRSKSASAHHYNLQCFDELVSTLVKWADRELRPTDAAAATREAALVTSWMRKMMSFRHETAPRLSGSQFLRISIAAQTLPASELLENLEVVEKRILESKVKPPFGPRVFVTGSPVEDAWTYELFESLGFSVVGEDHSWGEGAWPQFNPGSDPMTAIFDHYDEKSPASRSGLKERCEYVAKQAEDVGAEVVFQILFDHDEATGWEFPLLREILRSKRISLVQFKIPYRSRDASTFLNQLHESFSTSSMRAGYHSTRRKAPMAASEGMRRRSELNCTREITSYQKNWFLALRERVKEGEPFAVLSADSPHEIYRAMDIPYVVVQWWSSVIAAKQKAPAYITRLKEAGFPDQNEQYSALPFGELLDDEPSEAPWGGLPRPTILQCSASTDGIRKLYEAWADHAGAAFFPVERSIDSRLSVPEKWWEELPHNWDTFLPAPRLDFLTAELADLIRKLESLTGKTFSQSRFEEIMELSNQQAEANREARDLIARTSPAPVTVAETMAATMIPQWHRGSTWGRDAARSFADEIKQRIESGASSDRDERLRLMWLGRGLWSSLGFYEAFAERGAVFVWSMYLGLAADGYLRYVDGRDPLRALAARFVPMGDELRMPGWSSAWHLKEARLHHIDGVVSLGEDDYFSARLLKENGIPLLSINADNVDRRTWNESSIKNKIEEFLDQALIKRSQSEKE